MSLKDNLIEELQKLRVAREKPSIAQMNKRVKKAQVDKHMDEAKRLLAQIEEGESE